MISSNKAFTMIELLFVIIALSIIAAIIFDKPKITISEEDKNYLRIEVKRVADDAKKIMKDVHDNIEKIYKDESTNQTKKETTEWN